MRSNNTSGGPESGDGLDQAERKMSRPMWALTKADAQEKQECMDDAEAEDLIAFANNLDIDQFMDDVEIKARVAQVEQQMAQLQSIVDYEDAEEKRAERDQQRLEDSDGKVVALNAYDLARLNGGASGQAGQDDDVMSVASSVLSECKSIRSVHSMRSVAALTKRAEAKIGDGSSSRACPETPMVNPRIVTVDEEQGARLQLKQNPSNLPYLHRNPAI